MRLFGICPNRTTSTYSLPILKRGRHKNSSIALQTMRLITRKCTFPTSVPRSSWFVERRQKVWEPSTLRSISCRFLRAKSRRVTYRVSWGKSKKWENLKALRRKFHLICSNKRPKRKYRRERFWSMSAGWLMPRLSTTFPYWLMICSSWQCVLNSLKRIQKNTCPTSKNSKPYQTKSIERSVYV